MVRLIIAYERERLVDFHDRYFQLRERLVCLPDFVCDWRFTPCGEIKVYDFVRET